MTDDGPSLTVETRINNIYVQYDLILVLDGDGERNRKGRNVIMTQNCSNLNIIERN